MTQIGKREIARVVCPIYCMPAALVRWSETYKDYHTEKLTMKGATLETCLVYRKSVAELDGMICIVVYDTMSTATRKFAGEDERCSRKFPSSGL